MLLTGCFRALRNNQATSPLFCSLLREKHLDASKADVSHCFLLEQHLRVLSRDSKTELVPLYFCPVVCMLSRFMRGSICPEVLEVLLGRTTKFWTYRQGRVK